MNLEPNAFGNEVSTIIHTVQAMEGMYPRPYCGPDYSVPEGLFTYVALSHLPLTLNVQMDLSAWLTDRLGPMEPSEANELYARAELEWVAWAESNPDNPFYEMATYALDKWLLDGISPLIDTDDNGVVFDRISYDDFRTWLRQFRHGYSAEHAKFYVAGIYDLDLIQKAIDEGVDADLAATIGQVA